MIEPGPDCGHVCCPNSDEPGHGHFLDPEECPGCAGALRRAELTRRAAAATASRVRAHPAAARSTGRPVCPYCSTASPQLRVHINANTCRLVPSGVTVGYSDGVLGTIAERAWQAEAEATALACGFLACHVRPARVGTRVLTPTSAPGFPDLWIADPAGRVLAAELKPAARGKLEPDQVAWLDSLAAVPGVTAWLLRPQDLPWLALWLRRLPHPPACPACRRPAPPDHRCMRRDVILPCPPIAD